MIDTTNDINEALALDVAALGYPGFAHLRDAKRQCDPAQLLCAALRQPDLESRLIEAMPWVLLNFPTLPWADLRVVALREGWQNRLGFLLETAQQLAAQTGALDVAAKLASEAAALEPLRTTEETTLCHDSLTQVERRFLASQRPMTAQRWHLLTDLQPEHLIYARS